MNFIREQEFYEREQKYMKEIAELRKENEQLLERLRISENERFYGNKNINSLYRGL